MASSSTSEPEIGTSDDAASIPGKTNVTISRAGETNLRDDEDARSNFLASFTAKEADAIMKKVDNRFLVLIGLMYMIKQASDTRQESSSFRMRLRETSLTRHRST